MVCGCVGCLERVWTRERYAGMYGIACSLFSCAGAGVRPFSHVAVTKDVMIVREKILKKIRPTV